MLLINLSNFIYERKVENMEIIRPLHLINIHEHEIIKRVYKWFCIDFQRFCR